MTKEYTYQDLFKGEKFVLDSALRDGVDYEAFRGLRMLLMLSHNQINRLEARITELESKMDFLVKPNNLPVESSRLSKLKETVDKADAIVMGYVPDDFRG